MLYCSFSFFFLRWILEAEKDVRCSLNLEMSMSLLSSVRGEHMHFHVSFWMLVTSYLGNFLPDSNLDEEKYPSSIP